MNNATSISVSAVIPTRSRPHLLLRAIASARTQTLQPAEIIVVIDGPDRATRAALELLADPLLKVIELAERSGPSIARNVGVQHSRSDWVAFLDDDDEWHPKKLELQLEAARRSPATWPVITCQVNANTARGCYVWPNRQPRRGQHLSEFLIDRTTIWGRPGYIATPTLIAPRDLLLTVPIPNEEDHEDWSWLLKATALPQTEVSFVWQPLCTVHVQSERESRSKRDHWRVSFDWCNRHAPLLTRRAYAAFMLTKVAGMARRQKQWNAIPALLLSAWKYGQPSVVHYAIFLGTWALPRPALQFFRILNLASMR